MLAIFDAPSDIPRLTTARSTMRPGLTPDPVPQGLMTEAEYVRRRLQQQGIGGVMEQMRRTVEAMPPLPDLDELPHFDELIETLIAERARPATWAKRIRELILDRIDAAYRDGYIRLDAEQYGSLLMAIMPDEFAIPPEVDRTEACQAPPGSTERVTRYMLRCQRAVSLWHLHDAQPDSSDESGPATDRVVRISKLGWQEPRVHGFATTDEALAARLKRAEGNATPT